MPIRRFSVPEPVEEAGRVDSYVRTVALNETVRATLASIVAAAQKLFETPIAIVSLADNDQILFAVDSGNCEPLPRRLSLCGHALLEDEPFVVLDTVKDPRFAGNPYVIDGPKLRFYAGAPLRAADGLAYGMLCVQDVKPRQALKPHMLAELTRLAERVTAIISAHRRASSKTADAAFAL